MSRITALRAALLAALPDDLKAEVVTGPQEAGATFGAKLATPRMLLRVYAGRPSDEAAQERLDTLLDPDEDGSIPDLLYTDQTLGGVVKSLHIVSTSGWRIYGSGQDAVLGAEFSVQITDKRPERR